MVHLLPVLLALALCSCGALTGLPGHGGGKRFAIEQELVAAATRGAIKQIDLAVLKGRHVNLFVNAIGDSGSGNIVGGRYSLVSQLRGDYVQSPVTTERSVFPRYTTSSTSDSHSTTGGTSTSSSSQQTAGSDQVSTGSSTGENSSTTSTRSTSSSETVLAFPEVKRTRQAGSGGIAQFGVEYQGLGAYQNSEEISSNDLQYLSALLQTYLFLQGVLVVPPSEAEVDLYVTVDVFGTIRTRVDWLVSNNEILRAKTALEVLAVARENGAMLLAPQTASAESEYNEQFLFWIGPVAVRKTLRPGGDWLSDFVELGGEAAGGGAGPPAR